MIKTEPKNLFYIGLFVAINDCFIEKINDTRQILVYDILFHLIMSASRIEIQ